MDETNKNMRALGVAAAGIIIETLQLDLAKVAENPKFRLTAGFDREFKRIWGWLKRLNELIQVGDDTALLTKISFDILASYHSLSDDFLKTINLETEEKHLIELIAENADKLYNILVLYADDVEAKKKLRSRPGKIETDELQSKFAALSGAAESMGQMLAAAEARIAALSELGNKSAETIDEITRNLAREAKKELSMRSTGLSQEFERIHEEIRSRSEEFEGYQEQALGMLGQMSATVLSGGYLGSAQREESAANLFRWLCIGLMALTVVFLVATIYQLSFDGLDWKIALTRLLATLLMAVPTAYLARESGKHRIQANKLRKTSLDFSVLEPFLKSVEGDLGSTLRSELARRVFFSDADEDKASSYPMEPQVIILKALDAIEKMSKR